MRPQRPACSSEELGASRCHRAPATGARLRAGVGSLLLRVVLLASLVFAWPACGDGQTSPATDAGDGAGAGESRCLRDEDCRERGGGVCITSTGQCSPATCFDQGCPPGSFCNPATLTCVAGKSAKHARYRAETILGHNILQRHGARDGVGISALGEFSQIVASRVGRYLFILDNAVLRVDQVSMRLETFSGIGWPGEVDGPAAIAQYDHNFYQAGGLALSPDERSLVFTGAHALRKVDLQTGEGSTLHPPGLEGLGVRSLAFGPSGALYLLGSKSFYVLTAADQVEERPLDSTNGWGDKRGDPPGYLVVDESRGLAYGLERNRMSGALYRWPLAGGPVEWLNHAATGERNLQNESDGPVANLQMANPGGLTIDAEGYVYIGAGDGRSFRRYDPDGMVVESLCRRTDVPASEHRLEWCIGDNDRNLLFNTWPSFLSFDGLGNGYFGFTVWPRLVRLTRED